MIYPVFVKNYSAPPVNKREILRYAGVKKDSPELNALIDECLLELKNKLTYSVVYGEYPLKFVGEKIDLTFCSVLSSDLSKALNGCQSFVLFCATIGVGIDRLITKYSHLSPTKALIFQAIGTERIESLCNLFNSEIKQKYKFVKPRFSPGYGDLPLELQTDVFNALNCSKIGVTLNKSLLMSPSKSVTAIIGIASDNFCLEETSCNSCQKKACEFRKENEY